jgi:hypothetical protein
MFSSKKKYEVSDPGFYDQLIVDQKKRIRKNRTNPDGFLELGRLFEARVAMTKEFASKKFFFGILF